MKTRKLLPIMLGILAILLLYAPDVFPRAGSGQKYRPPSRPSRPSYNRPSSPSGGGGYMGGGSYNRRPSYGGGYIGHSGGGYGGAGCCASISGCTFLIVVIVIVGIVLIIWLLTKKKGDSGGNPYGGGGGGYYAPNYIPPAPVDVMALPPIDEAKVARQLAAFKEKDPYFSEKVFLDKAQTAFFEIQRAWSKNDLEPVRSLMSESQFNRMNMQLSEYKDKGWRNVVEDLVIGSIKIAEIGVEGEYDFIKTRIHASLSDKTYDKNGKIVEGSNEIVPMAEYWTFVRKLGAKTNADGGRTRSHNCPNCGAPVETGESGKCQFCDATLTAASFDWVLDSITQGVEESLDYQSRGGYDV